MFLDLEAALDLVDPQALFHYMVAQSVPQNASIFWKLFILTPQEELEFTGN